MCAGLVGQRLGHHAGNDRLSGFKRLEAVFMCAGRPEVCVNKWRIVTLERQSDWRPRNPFGCITSNWRVEVYLPGFLQHGFVSVVATTALVKDAVS